MKERISTVRVKKEPGYLYYVDKQGDISKVPMINNKRGRKAKVAKAGIKKAAGYLYFIDKAGYVARTKAMRGRKKVVKKKKK